MRHHALIARGEHDLLGAYQQAQAEFLDQARTAILGRPVTAADTGQEQQPPSPPPQDQSHAAPDPSLNLDLWPDRAVWVGVLAAVVLPRLKRWYQRVFNGKTRSGLRNPPDRTWADVEREYQAAFQRDVWSDQVYGELRGELDDSRNHADPPNLVHRRVERLLAADAPVRRIRDTYARRARRDLEYAPDLGPDDYAYVNTARVRARWSTVGIANRAQLDAAHRDAKHAGEPLYTSWLCTHDQRVRDSHFLADKQSVPLGEPFHVGGALLRFPGDPLGPPAESANCRCALAVHGREDHDRLTKEREMELPNRMDADGNPLVADATTEEEPKTVRWHGMLAPLDTRADTRVIGKPENGEVETNRLPILSYQEASAPGHDGKVRVGRIDKAWVQDGQLWGEGEFNAYNSLAQQVIRDIRNGFDGNVSVDLADAQGEERCYDADGYELDMGDLDIDTFAAQNPTARRLTYYPKWRLAGATLVQDPAFHTGWVQVVDDQYADGDGEGIDQQDEPGAETEPESETKAADAEAGEHGEDGDYVARTKSGAVSQDARDKAARDGNALPDGSFPINNVGDLRNAVQAIGRAKDPARAKAHIRKRARELDSTHLLPDEWSEAKKNTTAAGDRQVWAEQVAACAAANTEPDPACFDDPGLDRPTKITVRDDGTVYGHVACWNTAHISFPGRDIRPPRSETNYAMFHRHPVRCSDGSRIRTGCLVMGTGHADLSMSTSAASNHYDHTGHIVADVRAGEDEHGIWVAGALHPGVTPLQVTVLDRYSLSGDWRGGELVSALVVNTPGFPIPDTMAASGELPLTTPSVQVRTDEHGEPHALVAAGIVPVTDDTTTGQDDLAGEIRALREELAAERATREAEAARVAAQEAEQAARARIASLAHRVHRPTLNRIAAFAQNNNLANPPSARPRLPRTKTSTPNGGSKNSSGDDEGSGGSPSGGGQGKPNKPKPKPDPPPDPKQVGEDYKKQKEEEQQVGLLDDPPGTEPAPPPDKGLLDDGDTGNAPSPEDFEIMAAILDELDEEDIALIEALTGQPVHAPSSADNPDPDGDTPPNLQEAVAQKHADAQPDGQQPGKSSDGSNAGTSGKGAGATGQPAAKKKPQPAQTGLTAAKTPNWVSRAGGLPPRTRQIANHLKAKGFTESHAIAVAINVDKKICRNADDRLNWPGSQRKVRPNSIAEGCASIAHWEAMKAHAHASHAEKAE